MRLNGNLAASCIVLHDNKVLLVRHTYGIAKNKYFVPGGNLQPGELLEQTAVREVFEETSVRIKIRDCYLSVLHQIVLGSFFLQIMFQEYQLQITGKMIPHYLWILKKRCLPSM